MPKRVIDFDAMWGSDKLAACATWAQAEYAWLYGLADASGCFELTNLRVIWGRVAAIRGNFTIERLEQVFAEFQDKGLLFVWEHEGKRYAHWTGSDVPGRLPPPSWRMRLERFAPPVPKQRLTEYMARFARGRAALAGVGFRGEAQQESSNRKENCKFENSELKEDRGRGGCAQSAQLTEQRLLVTDHGEDRGDQNVGLKGNVETRRRFGNSEFGEGQRGAVVGGRDGMGHRGGETGGGSGLKGRLEEGQAQDLDLDWNLNEKWEVERDEGQGGPGDAQDYSGGANREKEISKTDFCKSNSSAKSLINVNSKSPANSNASSNANPDSNATPPADLDSDSRTLAQMDRQSRSRSSSGGSSTFAWRDKDLAVARELRVGQGPVCGPARVRPEVLERVRRREAARAGSRSP